MFPGVTARSNLHNPGSEDESLEENLGPGPLLDAEDYIRDDDELFGQRGDDTFRAQDEDHADILKGRASIPATLMRSTYCIAAKTPTYSQVRVPKGRRS